VTTEQQPADLTKPDEDTPADVLAGDYQLEHHTGGYLISVPLAGKAGPGTVLELDAAQIALQPGGLFTMTPWDAQSAQLLPFARVNVLTRSVSIGIGKATSAAGAELTVMVVPA